jgi:hypothetical protein
MDDFLCPRCGRRETPANQLAAERLRRAGRCQGCRAGTTLRERPWLLPLFVDFWKRSSFPSSDSWLEEVGAAGDAEGCTPGESSGIHLDTGGPS